MNDLETLAIEAAHEAARVSIPAVTLRPLTLDWSRIAKKAEHCGRGLFTLRIGGLCCAMDSTYEQMNEPPAMRRDRAERMLEERIGSYDATPLQVQRTAFSAVKMLVDHELLEFFTVDGARLFDPHDSNTAHGESLPKPRD